MSLHSTPSLAGRSPSRISLLAAGLALVVASAAPLQAQEGVMALEGEPVVAITFDGLERQAPQAVLALMETRVGGTFSAEALDRDVKRLAGGLLAEEQSLPEAGRPQPGQPRPPVASGGAIFQSIPSVRAELDPARGGVVVTFIVEENRRVLETVFLGALDQSREDLEPLIRTRAGAFVDDFLLEQDRQAVIEHYRKLGYAYADVEYRKNASSAGDIIVFRITEGPEVGIREVRLDGATAFPMAELLEQMPFVDEPGWFTSKDFILDEVRRDAAALEQWYRGRGFRNARVLFESWTPSADLEDVDLRFRVLEGERFRVRSVRIEGLNQIDAQDRLVLMRTQPGDWYEPGDRLERDREEIEEALQELGFVSARVLDASLVDLELPEVDVVIEVTEGQRATVGAIIIQGTVETQDNVLRRDIDLYSGQPLNLKKLRRAEQRIRGLGYWARTPRGGVEVTRDQTSLQNYSVFREAYVSLAETDQESVRDIVVTVEETDTSLLNFGVGVGSNSGLIGDVTFTKNNFDPFDWPESFSDIPNAFTGAGQRLVLSLQPGPQFTRYRLAWSDPRIFDSPYGIAVDLYRTRWRREDWDEDRLGYSIRGARRIGDELLAAVTLRDELVDVTNIDSDAPQLVFDFEGEFRTTSLTAELRLDRLDNPVRPREGYEATLALEHAGLWGDIEFNKVRIEGSYHWLLGVDDDERPYILRSRGTLGWAEEYGSTRDIPVTERFFAGGARSIRGFDFRGVGPRDADEPIGGKAIWLANLEMEFPILGEQLRGVAFVDTGAVGLDWSSNGISEPRVSVGVGIRLVIPFLAADRPVAIDLGFPLLDQPGDEGELISFSFGR